MLILLFQVAFAEDAQIQDHLSHVAQTLRTETPADLPDDVRQRRLGLLDLLDDYAAGGVFPDNAADRLPIARAAYPPRAFSSTDWGRAPTFVDDSGVHCAVGYLMGVDRPDLVARVVSEANEAYVPEMQVDGVAEWAEWAGFTLDELAWIQPQYPTRVGTCPDDISDWRWDRRSVQIPDEVCGEVAVSVQQFQDGCEVCDEGHLISVVVTNNGTVDTNVDLVVRTAAGVEVARESDITVYAEKNLGTTLMVARWQDVTNNGATVSVEADNNCVNERQHTFEIRTETNGPELEGPRCGALPRRLGCSTQTSSGPTGLLALGLFGLLLRRRRQRGPRK